MGYSSMSPRRSEHQRDAVLKFVGNACENKAAIGRLAVSRVFLSGFSVATAAGLRLREGYETPLYWVII